MVKALLRYGFLVGIYLLHLCPVRGQGGATLQDHLRVYQQHWRMGEYDTCLMVCDTMERLAPDSPAVYEARAKVYIYEHQWERGIATAAQAVQLAPDRKGAHELIFWTALRLRDARIASEQARIIARIDPADPWNADKAARARSLAWQDILSYVYAALLCLGWWWLLLRAARQVVRTGSVLPERAGVVWCLVAAVVPACGIYYLFQPLAPWLRTGNDTYLPQMYNPACVRDFTFDHDGREGLALYALYVLAIGLSAVLWLALTRVRSRTPALLVLLAGALCLPLLLLHTGVYVPQAVWPRAPLTALALAAGIMAVSTALALVVQRYRLAGMVAATAIAALALLRCDHISVYDYSFMLSPALRLYHHVPVREIYFQYDLFISCMALALMRLGADVFYMAVIARVGYVLLFTGLFWLGRSWFHSRRLAALLLVFVVLVRLYANMEPVAQLQITPWRLDFWLPVLVLAYRRGLYHWSVAVALGALIIIHRNFGFFYLAGWLEAVACYTVYMLWAVVPQGERRHWLSGMLRHGLAAACILGLALVAAYIISGGILPESALLYNRLGVGMIPISAHSIYWYMPVLLGGIAVLLLRVRGRVSERYFTTGILLLFLTVGESMYFFGRSHDHNIINIAAPVSLCLFLLLDLLGIAASDTDGRVPGRWGRLALRVLPYMLTGVAAFSYYDAITDKARMQYDSLAAGTTIEKVHLDFDFDKLRQATGHSSKVFFMDFDHDMLYYYYGGYAPQGYYCPLGSWLLKKDMVAMLQGLLDQGYYVVVMPGACSDEVIRELRYGHTVPMEGYSIIRE